MDVWHSRIFNVHAWSEHKQIAGLTETVFESFSPEEQSVIQGRSRNRGKTDLYRHLRTVLVDQYAGWKSDPTLCTGISRNKNDYIVRSRYNGLHISHRITDVCDILVANDFLETSGGSYNHTNASGGNRTTRIKPTPKLEGLFEKVGLETFELSLNENRECIT
jgi:hypothetical protein